jgi:Cyclic nucleotide-binding domain
MPYRLNKAIYSVRCRNPGCTFNAQLEIEENIMGMTESDVETEARKVARDMAQVKHDSLHGRHHSLLNPEIHRSSGTVQLVGAGPVQVSPEPPTSYVREYKKGEVILKEGDDAPCVCEVVKGAAFPRRNRNHRYVIGDCFGVAALLPNHSRMTDVVAGTDRTRIAFYSLPELNKRDPRKANQVFTRVLEDTLHLIGELERHAEPSAAR